jgi:uncharacterized membrane protein (UPF0127 family)
VIARDAANLLHMIARLEVASTRRALATNIHVADTFVRRLRGLVGRPSLEQGEALLFERARQVHTFGMRFPIDVVFCDRDWLVVHVVAGLRPRRVTRFVREADRVVELPAGAAAGLRRGDRLVAS